MLYLCYFSKIRKMDIITNEKRSWNMSRIQGKDTKPELIIRSLLHSSGYRFRLHAKKLPGVPDIVLPKYKTVIFVHGCFWHRHKGCKFTYTPKSRVEFWESKFQKNKERDRIVMNKLKKLGWKIIVIWECEISNPDNIRYKLKKHLEEPQKADA